MPDQIPQFVNQLNHLLYNIDALFICAFTFCICSISPKNEGTKLSVPSGKSTTAGSRPFNCLFTLRILRKSLLVVNLTIVQSLSFRRWHTWLSRSHMFMQISWNMSQTFCSRSLFLTDIGYYNHLQHVPPQVLSIFPTLKLTRHNPFYQLTIHIPDNSQVCL